MEQKERMTFYEVFHIGMGEEPHNPICDALVESISIQKETNTLNLVVRSDVLCDGAAVSAAKKELVERFHLGGINLRIRYDEKLLNAEYFDGIKTRIIADFPGVCAYLTGSEWVWNNEKLVIRLPNGGEEYLKDCVRKLQQEILKSFDVRVPVELQTIARSDEDQAREIEALHERLMEENAKRLAAMPKAEPRPKKEEPQIKKPWDGKMYAKFMSEISLDELNSKKTK